MAKAISPDSFEKWNAEHESHWKLAYENEGGIVLLYGDPSLVHENQQKLSWGADNGQEAGMDLTRFAFSPLCQLGSSKKRPDLHSVLQIVGTAMLLL